MTVTQPALFDTTHFEGAMKTLSQVSCLASLLVLIHAAPATAQTRKVGAFEVTESREPAAAARGAFVSTMSTARPIGILALTCVAGQFRVALSNRHLGFEEIRAQYGFDEGPLSDPMLWTTTTAGAVAALPFSEAPAFADAARRSSRLVIQTTNAGTGLEQTFVFNLRGFAQATRALPCATGTPTPSQ
jgi:hypothetical protein